MATSIKATLHMVPNSRTPKKGSKWAASCEWDGRTFEAASRSGASLALCRELVAAGCPDQPMEVWASRYTGPVDPNTGIGVEIMPTHPSLHIASIHKAARRTIVEGSRTPIREERWQPHPGASGRSEGQTGAISPPPVPEQGSAESRTGGETEDRASQAKLSHARPVTERR